MKKFYYILLLILFTTFVGAQKNKGLDSLTDLCSALRGENSQKFPENAHVLYGQIKTLNDNERRLNLENSFGIYYTINQKFDSGFVYFSRALETANVLKDTIMVANINMNIGIVMSNQNNYQKAEFYFLNTVKQGEALNNNYLQLKALFNLSGLYLNWKKYDQAIQINRKVYDLALISKDTVHQIRSLEAIGSDYSEMKNLDSAKHYLLLAYEKATELNFTSEIPFLSSNLGAFFIQIKNYPAAEKFLLLAKDKALMMNYNNSFMVNIYNNLKDLYFETKDYEKSIYFFNKADSLKTTIYNEDLLNTTSEMEAKYQSEKKENELKQASKELLIQSEKNKQKTIIIWLSVAVLLGTGFFGILAFMNFKKAKNSNIIIQTQNETLALKNSEVEKQKKLVEEKQKEIIDSINYAQKIQTAVLTGEQIWKKISTEYFILFQPKDIVSGDFYWAYNTVNNRSIIALADCTGHGVPGGFMSMLGNSFLNELVVENKIFKPDEILNRLRKKIISSLGQKGSTDRRDGMDMAICTWNKLDNTLEFAGANNKLWIIKNGELNEYDGDKMPIGNYEGELKPFNCYNIQLEKNDLIVLSTDGFADQFGGEGGKKLMSKNLKAFLVNNSDLPLENQKIELTNMLRSWAGSHEQVDDISLIMIKVV